MRSVLYLGSAGCDAALVDALARHLDEVMILVPAEPRLVGALAGSPAMGERLVEVASRLAERARTLAASERNTQAAGLGRLFGLATPQLALASINARVLGPPLETTLPQACGTDGTAELYASRDALDVLASAGVNVRDALSSAHVRLIAR